MYADVQYVVDDKGSKVSVILPVADWEKFNMDYQKLIDKFEIIKGIQEGIGQVKEAKETEKTLQTLSDFLDEN